MLHDFFVSNTSTSHLLRFIETRGLDLEQFKAQLSKLPPQRDLAYEQWWELLEILDNTLQEPALGIRIGQSVKVEHCGVLGYLFRTSKNVLDALACYRRFERLIYTGNQVETKLINGRELCLSWDHGDGFSSLTSDAMFLSALVNIIREILSDPEASPSKVIFTHPIPERDSAYYHEFFACELGDNQVRLEIHFPIQTLEKAIPFYDQSLHDLLGQQAQSLVEQLPLADTFMQQSREAIVTSLNGGTADADSVAKQLGVSERTLHRKLKEKGHLYRDVLREVRKSLAQRYLCDNNVSLTEAAMLLGYSEQSAFTRAFKSWFDCTPKRYRERHATRA